MKEPEKWMQLCEQAAHEQDSEKLMALVREIDRLLAEKEQRLKGQSLGKRFRAVRGLPPTAS